MSTSSPRRARPAVAALVAATVAGLALVTPGSAAAAPAPTPTPTPTKVAHADLAPSCAAPSAAGICTELTAGGTAQVVNDARAQIGRGYLRLSTPDAASHATVYTTAFTGRKLTDIDTLAFRTLLERQVAANPSVAPSINIAINPNKAGKTFSTLVWEPIYTGAPVLGSTWQSWSPSTSQGGWWATRALSDTGTPNIFGFPSYTATFAQVKAALPDAVILGVAVNQGSGSPGLVAGVDGFTVNGTTYDFENPYAADLALSITLPPVVRPSAQVAATVTVTNAGTFAATATTVAVTAAPGLTVTAAPGALVVAGKSLVYRLPSLAPGASASFPVTLVVDRTARSTVSLIGGATSAVPDPNPADNAARAVATVS
jgi:Domain of unknown function DUF11